ncbi:MAG UNVERIFIED_CONTAM: hypothetical protein LVR18_32710 [Planctomycetaceae bacterium]|jgi:hypothetical protein
MTRLIRRPFHPRGTRLITAPLLFGCVLGHAGCGQQPANDAGSPDGLPTQVSSESAPPANVTPAPWGLA